MVSLVARQGRELQRYSEDGHRLVVGCIPYKLERYKTSVDGIAIDQSLQVLVISAQKGQEMLFPRGGWESDESEEEATSREAMEEAGVLGNVEEELGRWWYQSKSHDSRKMGIMFPLNVTKELHQWPEMGNRRRRWVTVAEAMETCKQVWMLDALSRLVCRLSSVLWEHTASPPRNIADQPPREKSGKLTRGSTVPTKERESPVTVAEARETCQQVSVWMLDALSMLVGWLSSFLREHTASPPRSIADQPPWKKLGKLKRGSTVPTKEPERPVVVRKNPMQFDSFLSFAGFLEILWDQTFDLTAKNCLLLTFFPKLSMQTSWFISPTHMNSSWEDVNDRLCF